MELFIQICLNGLAAGAVYSLVAAGYSLVYGVLRFINFAHAASIAVGGYVFLVFTSYLGLRFGISFILALILTGGFGLIVNRIAYYPLRRTAPLFPLLSGIAFLIVVENLIVLIFGPDPYRFSSLPWFSTTLVFDKYSLSSIHLWMLVAAGLSGITLHFLLRYTAYGRMIRAAAENQELAQTRGIDTESVIAKVFFASSILAAVAGIFIAYETQLYPQIGALPSLKGFVAALIGGLGNISGAIIAGLFLGLLENILIIGLPTVYKDGITFVVMILFLLVKPEGLFPNLSKRY